MDANLTKLLYAAETAFNETPDNLSTLQELRYVSESVNHVKSTVVSEEVRSDRARADLVQVGKSAEGSVELELILQAYDDLILAALLGTSWTSGQDTGLTLTSAAAGQTITASVGTFSASTQAAKLVKLAGFTDPSLNGIFAVVSATSTVLTLAPGSITVDEGPTASCTADYRYARNGTTFRSFLFEKQFLSLTTPLYQGFTGMVVNEMGLSMEARAIARATFGMLGAQGLNPATSTNGDGSPTSPSTNGILNTSSNIGGLLWSGAALAANLMSFDMTLNNNMRDRPVISSLFTLEHGKGTIDLTGTLTAYFEDETLLDAFINHSSASLLMPYQDAAGNGMSVFLPNIKFPNGNPVVEGINTDLMVPLEYQALVDSTLGYVVQVDSLAAA